MVIRMQYLIDYNAIGKRLHSGCFVFFVLLLTASPAFSGDAELTNLIVRNKNDQLQVDLRVKSEPGENKAHFTGFPWEFETDWYTLNFIY